MVSAAHVTERERFARSLRRLAVQNLIIRVLAIVAVLVVWEYIGRVSPPYFLSPFHETVVAIYTLTMSGALVTATANSLAVLATGLAIATVGGLVLGLLMGRYKVWRWVLEPYVNGVYATPTIAFLPIVSLWFGLYFGPKVAIVVLIAIFPILKNVVAGVATVDDEYLEPAASMRASELQIFFNVVVPATVPFIIAGLRLAIGRGIVGVVVGEFFTAQTGLGGMIVLYASSFRTAEMFVPVVVLVFVGLSLTELVSALQRRLAPWKESERDQGL